MGKKSTEKTFEIAKAALIKVLATARFWPIYEQYASREKEMAVLPESVKTFLGGTVKSLPA